MWQNRRDSRKRAHRARAARPRQRDRSDQERGDEGIASNGGLAVGRVGAGRATAAQSEPPAGPGNLRRSTRACDMGRCSVDRARAMATRIGTFVGAGSRIGVPAGDARRLRPLAAGGGDRGAPCHAVAAQDSRVRIAERCVRAGLSRSGLRDRHRVVAPARSIGERTAGQPLSRALPSRPSVVWHASFQRCCICAPAAWTVAFMDAVPFRWPGEQRWEADRRCRGRGSVSGVDAGAGRRRRVAVTQLTPAHFRTWPPVAHRGRSLVLFHAWDAVHRTPRP